MTFIRTSGLTAGCLSLTLILACQSKNEAPAEETINYDSVEALVDTAASGSGDAVEFVECARGIPERIVKPSVQPQPAFELNKEKTVGTETLQFENGDRVIVKNSGCEYFIVTFRFETNRFQADTTDLMYWLDKSSRLVSEITEAIDAPLDFNDGVAAIQKMNGPEVKYELGQEIVYEDGDIRQYASLDRIQKMAADRFAVEITFGVGPF